MFFDTKLEKIEFRKKRGQNQGTEKKLGVLKGKMITKIGFSDSNTYFLIPNLKKLNFGKKGGFKGDRKIFRGIIDQNDYQNWIL